MGQDAPKLPDKPAAHPQGEGSKFQRVSVSPQQCTAPRQLILSLYLQFRLDAL